MVNSDLDYYRESSYDILRKANKSKNLCIAKPVPRNAELGNRGLNLVDLTLPFVGLLIIGAFACLGLLTEVIVYRFSNRRIQPSFTTKKLDLSPTP